MAMARRTGSMLESVVSRSVGSMQASSRAVGTGGRLVACQGFLVREACVGVLVGGFLWILPVLKKNGLDHLQLI